MNDHISGLPNIVQAALAVLTFVTSDKNSQTTVIKALNNLLNSQFDETVLNQGFASDANDFEPTIIPFSCKKINNHRQNFETGTILFASFQNKSLKKYHSRRFNGKDYTQKRVVEATHLKLFEPDFGSADFLVPVYNDVPVGASVEDIAMPKLRLYQ